MHTGVGEVQLSIALRHLQVRKTLAKLILLPQSYWAGMPGSFTTCSLSVLLYISQDFSLPNLLAPSTGKPAPALLASLHHLLFKNKLLISE